MAVRTRKMVAVTLETGSARTLVLDTYQGDTSLSGNQQGYVEGLPILDRGTYAESVEGDDQFPTHTVTLWHDGKLTDAVTAAILDMLNKQGAAAADVTTDQGNVTWHLKVTITVTHPAGGVDTYTLGNARVTWDYAAAADGNTISLSMTCYRPSGGADPIVWT